MESTCPMYCSNIQVIERWQQDLIGTLKSEFSILSNKYTYSFLQYLINIFLKLLTIQYVTSQNFWLHCRINLELETVEGMQIWWEVKINSRSFDETGFWFCF